MEDSAIAKPPRQASHVLAPVLATVAGILVVVAVWWLRIVPNTQEFATMGNGDLYTYFYPMLDVSFRELRRGHLFLWNPYQLGGIPGLATLQAGLLYPPHLLYLVTSTATALGVLTFVHITAVVLFTIYLGRTVALSWPASLIAGISFGLSAALPSIYWPSVLEPLVWLPLGIIAVDRTLHTRQRWWLPVLSLCVSMPLLAGGYQSTVYILYAFGLYGLLAGISLATEQRSVFPVVQRAWPLVVAIVAGVALAAPQLLSTLELAQQGARSTAALLPSQSLPFGSNAKTTGALLDALIVPRAQFVPEHIGGVVIALACAAILARQRLVIAFAAVVITWGLLAELAPNWFLRLQALLPAIAWFRAPHRVFILSSFGFALLAGIGFDALWRFGLGVRVRKWSVAFAVVGGVVAAIHAHPHPVWRLYAAFCLLAVIALLAGSRLAPTVLVAYSVVVLVIVDQVGFTRNTWSLPYANADWRRLYTHASELKAIRSSAGLNRSLLLGAVTLNPSWATKSAMLAGLFVPFDYEPLALKQYADFFEYAAYARRWSTGGDYPFAGLADLMSPPTPRARRFLNLLSVRFWVLPRLALFNQGLAELAGQFRPVQTKEWAAVADKSNLVLMEDPAALPRAYGVYNVECSASLDKTLVRLGAPDFIPSQSIVVQGACREEPLQLQGAAPKVSIDAYDSMEVHVSAEMRRPGFVVLTDSYYPGWQASVNGKPQPILRANAVVRAVRVPAGRSHVEFRYVPRSFYAGSILAAATILFGTIAMLRRRRHRDAS